MIVKSDTPQLLLAGLQPIFQKAYDAGEIMHSKIATTVNSKKDTESYAWLGAVTGMKEWTDERQDSDVLEHDFSIKNRSWEGSIAVDRDAVEDDQYGQINVRVRDLGTRAKQFPDELLFELLSQGNLITGTSANFVGKNIACYDSLAFFAANHTVGSTTQSNVGSTALGVTSLRAGITAMRRFQDDKNKPLPSKPDLLVVPADLEWEARELLNSAYFPSEGTTTAKLATNVLKGVVDLQVSNWLSDTNDWFLLDTKTTVKPLLYQLRRKPEFVSMTTGADAFMRKKWWYGVDARHNMGFGEWRNAYGAFVA